MHQIGERYTDMVTQHLLGMTYESRPMYYLKVSEKARNYHVGKESLLPPICGSLSTTQHVSQKHGKG